MFNNVNPYRASSTFFIQRLFAIVRFVTMVGILLFGSWRTDPQAINVVNAETKSFCQLTWNAVPDPNSVGAGAIAAISANDVWAASDSILHWDGTVWTPIQVLSNRAITKFAVVSPNDIWGAGWYIENSYYHTLVMHWDGMTWSDVPTPDIGNLNGIVATASDSIWVIGNVNREIPTSLHWNGTEWATIPMPYSDWRVHIASVTSISAISENDIWAVGAFQGKTSSLSDVMIWHWDGTQWNYMPSGMGAYSSFNSVFAVSANDVWAVGRVYLYDALIAHWDGTQWSAAAIIKKSAAPNVTGLIDVFGFAANEAWAVGWYETENSHQMLIAHWDGASWNVVNMPHQEGYQNSLAGVAGVSPTDIWAAGFSILHGTLPCVSTQPEQPELLSPQNGKKLAHKKARLKWNPTAGAAWYEITIKRGAKLIEQQWNLENTRYKTISLARGKVFKWQVKACNSVGCNDSPWWRFFTSE